MTTRRKFIKKISTVGAALPLASQVSAKSTKKDNPIIICSRGEQWGEKVLKSLTI